MLLVEIDLEHRQTTADACLDLVHRAQRGDAGAFEQLYRRHVGRVYAICLRMLADEGLATTLTQDAFVRAWQTIGGFRGESAFSSWLYRVTVNSVLGHLRTERRRKARIRPEGDLGRYDRQAPQAPAGTALDLEKAIASLPSQARYVLVLHEIEGYQHAEIAEMMGIAEGTSKAHLHRARKLLKERLSR
jgi:RNA polymerase sigma-70 factor (ECF subfamily)